MKKLLFILVLAGNFSVSAQLADSTILGEWGLFKIIDNLTGEEIIPPKKKNDFDYSIIFTSDSLVKFNLEVNKCSNNFIITERNKIKFLYYAECTKICCDKEFSQQLIYEDCTSYYIKENQTLLLVSEDKVFYFTRK
jgi:hypothetical protein